MPRWLVLHPTGSEWKTLNQCFGWVSEYLWQYSLHTPGENWSVLTCVWIFVLSRQKKQSHVLQSSPCLYFVKPVSSCQGGQPTEQRWGWWRPRSPQAHVPSGHLWLNHTGRHSSARECTEGFSVSQGTEVKLTPLTYISKMQHLSCRNIFDLRSCSTALLDIIKAPNLDKFNSPRWEVTGINKEVEVVLQQREDAVSNTTASLQQHQPLGFKLPPRQAKDRAQHTTVSTMLNFHLKCPLPFMGKLESVRIEIP